MELLEVFAYGFDKISSTFSNDLNASNQLMRQEQAAKIARTLGEQVTSWLSKHGEETIGSTARLSHVTLSIDEAKADWSNVIAAALHYGTVFRIQGKVKERAVLRAHPKNKSAARKYRRAKPGSIGKIASKLEVVLEELRELAGRLERSTNVFDRRFRQVWRTENACSDRFVMQQ
jgi:hypothetical protein